ncbi:hypothetical protein N7486_003143 [Penicillium sp. IBT 16267x]|nr:hypothetical protein N7486_003143 [Penicillium sp. IBT 16267x]
MNTTSPTAKAEALIASIEQYGQGDYIGESISQLEHFLQAANQAREAGARDELVIAALLHDIGQVIPLESAKEVRMKLREGNENVGLCGLVASHVDAKRYLTAVNSEYYDSLSPASQASLAFQGGPFQGDELREFEEDPLKDDMVSVRLWDDGAKLVGIEATTPRAGAYLEMIVNHLS